MFNLESKKTHRRGSEEKDLLLGYLEGNKGPVTIRCEKNGWVVESVRNR